MSTRRKKQINSTRARILRKWLINEFGDGETIPCAFGCGRVLSIATVTLDHYPIPYRDGGKYSKDNIRAACEKCNSAERMVPMKRNETKYTLAGAREAERLLRERLEDASWTRAYLGLPPKPNLDVRPFEGLRDLK